MLASPVELWSALEKSRLLSAERVEELRNSADEFADPRDILRTLVHSHELTKWQAQQLYGGRHLFVVGKYVLLERLGRGAMGSVYKARHVHTGWHVALKMLSKQEFANSDQSVRFRREIQALSALNHPNIISAYDADCHDDAHFLVMEYVAGQNLHDYLTERHPLPVSWCAECIRQAALGLQHAHEHGLVHRDIKPANLLVVLGDGGHPDNVKVLDLGMARLTDPRPEDGEVTRAGQILGTPDYIAPEQARHASRADIRADVYSLGCTLFKILANRVPYEGENVIEKLMARASEEAPLVSSFRPDVPPELDRVVAKMLARAPEDRYQLPRDVARALAPFSLHPESAKSIPLPEDDSSVMDIPLSALTEDSARRLGTRDHASTISESIGSSGASGPETQDFDANAMPPRGWPGPDPDDEPGSALKHFLTQLKTTASAVGVESQPAPATSPAPPTPSPDASETPRPSRRSSEIRPALPASAGPLSPPPAASRPSGRQSQVRPALSGLGRPETSAPKKMPWGLACGAGLALGMGLMLAAGFLGFGSGDAAGSREPRPGSRPTSGTRVLGSTVRQSVLHYAEWQGFPVGPVHPLRFQVPESGLHALQLKFDNPPADGRLRLSLDGVEFAERLPLPANRGESKQPTLVPLGQHALTAGEHTLNIEFLDRPSWIHYESWHLLGPFDNPKGKGPQTTYPPERETARQTEYEGKDGQKIRWRKREFVDGQVHPLNREFGTTKTDAVAFLSREFRADKAGKLTIFLGSDDTLAVWLDGKQVLVKNEQRACIPYNDRVTLDLTAGPHRLLLKVCQGQGEWAFFYADWMPASSASLQFGLNYRLVQPLP